MFESVVADAKLEQDERLVALPVLPRHEFADLKRAIGTFEVN